MMMEMKYKKINFVWVLLGFLLSFYFISGIILGVQAFLFNLSVSWLIASALILSGTITTVIFLFLLIKSEKR